MKNTKECKEGYVKSKKTNKCIKIKDYKKKCENLLKSIKEVNDLMQINDEDFKKFGLGAGKTCSKGVLVI